MSFKKARDYRHPLMKRYGIEPIRPLVVSKLAAKRRGDKMKVRMLPFKRQKLDIAAIVEETRQILDDMIWEEAEQNASKQMRSVYTEQYVQLPPAKWFYA